MLRQSALRAARRLACRTTPAVRTTAAATAAWTATASSSKCVAAAPLTRAFGAAAAQDTPLTETVRDFLGPDEFVGLLKEKNIDFLTGVPDSLLKDFCAYATDNMPESNHIIAANEGAAISLAAGYHMATGRIPVVYMQNSGFGNCVNPLLSLADPRIYSIPMLVVVGWRGEPGKKDEPQHRVQGQVMSSMLTDMNLQYSVLPDYIEGARDTLDLALHYMEKQNGPYVLLVK
jgi:phosphonopyruvate decarboxylase